MHPAPLVLLACSVRSPPCAGRPPCTYPMRHQRRCAEETQMLSKPPIQLEVEASRRTRQTGLLAGASVIGGCLVFGVATGVFDGSIIVASGGALGVAGTAAYAYTWLQGVERGKPMDDSSFDVRPSEGKGMGLFAHNQIEPSTFLFAYEGEALDEDALFARYPDAKGRYVAGITDGVYVDAVDPEKSNLARYINHAPTGSVACNVRTYKQRLGPRPAMYFYVDDAPIRAGDELCFDYGDEYWLVLGETPATQ